MAAERPYAPDSPTRTARQLDPDAIEGIPIMSWVTRRRKDGTPKEWRRVWIRPEGGSFGHSVVIERVYRKPDMVPVEPMMEPWKALVSNIPEGYARVVIELKEIEPLHDALADISRLAPELGIGVTMPRSHKMTEQTAKDIKRLTMACDAARRLEQVRQERRGEKPYTSTAAERRRWQFRFKDRYGSIHIEYHAMDAGWVPTDTWWRPGPKPADLGTMYHKVYVDEGNRRVCYVEIDHDIRTLERHDDKAGDHSEPECGRIAGGPGPAIGSPDRPGAGDGPGARSGDSRHDDRPAEAGGSGGTQEQQPGLSPQSDRVGDEAASPNSD